MKKLFCIFAILLLALGLCACNNSVSSITPPSNGSDISDDTTIPPSTENEDDKNDGSDIVVDDDKNDNEEEGGGMFNEILVVYFSCTQTTEKIANYIVDKTGGTSYRIQPEVPYTEEDLKYYTDCRADREQADPTARPAIRGRVEDMDKYKTVFIGYPIWHGQAPKIIYTFLESYDFSGKTIVPFCTSHSSGIGTSDVNLHSIAPDAEWKNGRRFASTTSKDSVNEWIDSLNIKIETENENSQIYLTIGETRLTANLENNSATSALREKLKTASITINMTDYDGFEKVGNLGFDLPTSNEQITTQPCDFVLYQGNQLVIFYGSNSWNYTRLGNIVGIAPSELKAILGNGNVTITLSLS